MVTRLLSLTAHPGPTVPNPTFISLQSYVTPLTASLEPSTVYRPSPASVVGHSTKEGVDTHRSASPDLSPTVCPSRGAATDIPWCCHPGGEGRTDVDPDGPDRRYEVPHPQKPGTLRRPATLNLSNTSPQGTPDTTSLIDVGNPDPPHSSKIRRVSGGPRR